MHRIAILFLLACAPPTTSQPMPPPPASLSLLVDDLSSPTIHASIWGAPPGAAVELLGSTRPPRSDDCRGTSCLDIFPDHVLASGRADHHGRLTWKWTGLPAGPDQLWHLQAMADGISSNRLTRRSTGDCPDDAAEPNNTRATAAPAGSWTDLETCLNDEDWFVTEVPPGAGVRAEIRRPGQVDFRPHDEDVRIVIGDNAQFSTASWWVNRSMDTKRVYARVTSSRPHEPTYDLDFATVDIGECAPPSNISMSSAQPLPLDTPVRQRVCTDDERWFSIDVTDPGRLHLVFDTPYADGSVRVALIDAASGMVATEGDTGVLSHLVTPGTWLVRVEREPSRSDPLSDGVEFDLRTRLFDDGACDDDAFEPNDLIPTPILSGEQLWATGCQGDVDQYSFHLNRGQEYTFQALYDRTDNYQLPTGALHYPNGQTIYLLYTSNVTRLTATSTGIHRMELNDWRPGEHYPGVPYALRVDVLPDACTPDPFDAVDLAHGDTLVGRICPGGGVSVRVHADANQIVRMTTTSPSFSSVLAPQIRGTSGYPIVMENQRGRYVSHYRLTDAGAVAAQYPWPAGGALAGKDYAVAVEVVDPEPCLPPPNDSLLRARPISAGVHDVHVCDLGEAWFRLDPPVGDHLQLSLTIEDPNGHIGLRVLDATGTIVPDDVRTNLYRDQTGAPLWVKLDGQRSTLGGAIPSTLEVEYLTPAPCITDAWEPNDTPNDAAIVPFGTVNASACRRSDDYYAVPLSVGDQLRYGLEQHGEGSFTVDLLSPTGDVLTPPPIPRDGTAAVASVDGQYQIVVRHQSDAIDGASVDYSLTLERIPFEACNDDGLEPDNTSADATPALGDQAAVACLGDVDWFETWVAQNNVLEANVLFERRGGEELEVAILDASNTVLSSLQSTDSPMVLRTVAQQGGPHSIRVRALTDDLTGRGVPYNLQTSTIPRP